MAERALVEGLEKLEAAHPALRRKTDDDSLEGAIIVIRPQTGEIKAMVGGQKLSKVAVQSSLSSQAPAGVDF